MHHSKKQIKRKRQRSPDKSDIMKEENINLESGIQIEVSFDILICIYVLGNLYI